MMKTHMNHPILGTTLLLLLLTLSPVRSQSAGETCGCERAVFENCLSPTARDGVCEGFECVGFQCTPNGPDTCVIREIDGFVSNDGTPGSCSFAKLLAPFPSWIERPTGPVTISVLHFNDVSEIFAGQGGTVGGLARLATVANNLKETSDYSLALISGDFLSPSLTGFYRINGERVAGRAVVECFNEFLDLAILGNHEWDDGKDLFQRSMDEANFNVISGNTYNEQEDGSKGTPFQQRGQPLPRYVVYNFGVRFCVLGVTTDVVNPSWVFFEDEIQAVQEIYAQADPNCDIMVLSSHTEVEVDERIMNLNLPKLRTVYGGHEHVVQEIELANDGVIYQADSSARSAWRHTWTVDPITKEVISKENQLIQMNEDIPEDPVVKAIMDKWQNFTYSELEAQGYEPEKNVTFYAEPVSTLSSDVRTGPQFFPQSANRALFHFAKDLNLPDVVPELCFQSSGALRADDILVGNIIEYDMCRMYVFGEGFNIVFMTGQELLNTIQIMLVDNLGTGNYGQFMPLGPNPSDLIEPFECLNSRGEVDPGNCTVNGAPVDPAKTYAVVTSLFVAHGRGDWGFMAQYSKYWCFEDEVTECTSGQQVPTTINTPTSGGDLKFDIRDMMIRYGQLAYQ